MQKLGDLHQDIDVHKHRMEINARVTDIVRELYSNESANQARIQKHMQEQAAHKVIRSQQAASFAEAAMPGGLNKPVQISGQLTEFLGIDMGACLRACVYARECACE